MTYNTDLESHCSELEKKIKELEDQLDSYKEMGINELLFEQNASKEYIEDKYNGISTDVLYAVWMPILKGYEDRSEYDDILTAVNLSVVYDLVRTSVTSGLRNIIIPAISKWSVPAALNLTEVDKKEIAWVEVLDNVGKVGSPGDIIKMPIVTRQAMRMADYDVLIVAGNDRSSRLSSCRHYNRFIWDILTEEHKPRTKQYLEDQLRLLIDRLLS